MQTIKLWIDEGAGWPDEFSGERHAPPPSPRVTRIMDALRNGDRQLFRRLLRGDPGSVNLPGYHGSTLLMYVALYGDAEAVRLLLAAGADPNFRTPGNATALMYAVDDAERPDCFSRTAPIQTPAPTTAARRYSLRQAALIPVPL